MIWIQLPESHKKEGQAFENVVQDAIILTEKEVDSILEHYQKMFGVDD